MRTERTGYPILTSEQTRAMDDAVEREYELPLAVLMENAGRAVADVAMRMGGERIYGAVGAGNNGGDALVAGRILLGCGRKVTAVLTRPQSEMTGLVALAARRFADAGGCLVPAGAVAWENADLILDGLLGTGLTGSVREPMATVIAAINASGRPVLSIDVPSGVASDLSGEPEAAVLASRTVALAAWKPALVHYPAARWAGTVELADIGFPPGLYPTPDAVVLSGSFVRGILPAFPGESHKGTRGTLLVVAGSRGMAGAAALVCRSATLSGAGLVYLACPETLTPTYEVKLTDQVLRPLPDGGAGHFTPESLEKALVEVDKADAIVLGPGIGDSDEVADFVEGFVGRVDRPMLIDADGLNVLARQRFAVPPETVLTPHPGEMARLLECSIAEVQEDRLATARRAAERFGCVVVLKGAHTVIAAPGETSVVNTVSHPALATAGSGDVLSGVIGTLLAQRVRTFEAAIAGVRWHGTMGVLAASNMGGTPGASDLVNTLPRAREEILGNEDVEVLV